MKITDIKATTVAVPLEAPIRHSNGCHWGRFVRTIVEIETDEGITGLGEMGGGGQSAQAAFEGLKPYLIGHDPMQLEQMYWKICNPTASLYNNRLQLHAALEFACMDIVGKSWVYGPATCWAVPYVTRWNSHHIFSSVIRTKKLVKEA